MKTLAQVFSCEFWEISKNTFFQRTPLGDCFSCKNRFSYNCNQRNQKISPIALKWTAKTKPCYFSLCCFLNGTTLSLWTESVIIFLLLLKKIFAIILCVMLCPLLQCTDHKKGSWSITTLRRCSGAAFSFIFGDVITFMAWSTNAKQSQTVTKVTRSQKLKGILMIK